jgi:hypothetical protein
MPSVGLATTAGMDVFGVSAVRTTVLGSGADTLIPARTLAASPFNRRQQLERPS